MGGTLRILKGFTHVDVVVLVFLDNALGIVVRVERVHENEGHIDLVDLVEMLDLSHGEIQESHSFADFNCRLGRSAPTQRFKIGE